MTKLTVLGSCVSRVSLLRGDNSGHGITNGDKYDISLEYFLDKHNLALALLDPPFPSEEVDLITSDMLCDKSRDRSLRQQLKKETVPMLLNSESQYLIIDLYDFHNYIFQYQNTAFCTQANEFCGTPLFTKYADSLTKYNLLDFPEWILYSMVDRFFDTILPKFDSNHIILNRFRANKYMLYKNGQIGFIPEECTRDFQCHEKYNARCRALEDHIIQRINPWVIDISKFFMGDANHWDNWNASHYEEEFYRETYDQIIRIVTGQTNIRYYDRVQFFNPNRDGYTKDISRPYDIDWNIKVFELLMSSGDDVGINVLEQLYARAPHNPQIIKYMNELGLL